jgi:Fe-S cluster biogenesis protein NfuA
MVTDEKIVGKVQEAIDQMRPFLEQDGGDMELVEISDDMIVKVKFLGSCSSCDMSSMTLKAGVEEAVKRAVPEVKSVEAINLMTDESVA